MLHSNDNNFIFISNPLNTPTKKQTILNNKESEENSDVNETTNSSPANQSNENISSFAKSIETLQNFFLHEISDLRIEMKDMHECNKTNDLHAECNKLM